MILRLAIAASAGAADQDVRKHGAKGDGSTLDTAAFQAALDAACAGGGGVVRVPPGKYLIAGVQLKSNVTLQIGSNAVLLGSTDRKHYPGKSRTVLEASDAEHIVIEGAGEINGQATADYGARWGAPQVPEWRTSLVRIERCRDVTVRGVSLLYSDSWTLHLRRCQHVRVDGVTIRANYKRLNSDGIDPNSCQDVKITNCRITTGDDAIVLKSTEPEPCEDIEVSDCVLESATAALKLGTESKGDFRHIRMRNCKIVNSPVGVGVYVKDGAVVEDLLAERIEMQLCGPQHHAVVPLFIDIERRHADSKIGAVRDVTFRQIRITGGAGLLLQGMPESPLENFTLRDIRFEVKDPQDYTGRKKPVGGRRTTRDARDTKYAQAPTYAALAHMKNLTVDGLQVTVAAADFQRFPRSALALFAVEGAEIRGVTRSPDDRDPPVVAQQDSHGIDLTRPE
jgi:hypothetical protein